MAESKVRDTIEFKVWLTDISHISHTCGFMRVYPVCGYIYEPSDSVMKASADCVSLMTLKFP